MGLLESLHRLHFLIHSFLNGPVVPDLYLSLVRSEALAVVQATARRLPSVRPRQANSGSCGCWGRGYAYLDPESIESSLA